MYILPTPTHLEVVALGGSSNISPDQHLNYALIRATAPLRRLQGARPLRRARRLRRRLRRGLRPSRQGQGRRGSLRGARAGIVGGRAQLVPPPPSGGRPRPAELRETLKRSSTYCGAHRGSGPYK